MAFVFLLAVFYPAINSDSRDINILGMLDFNLKEILGGQVWRIITFIFMPPGFNPILTVFALYLFWLMGSALEREWGKFKFNIFYFCGIFATMAAGFITGYATNYFINMSIFLAFALLFPNFEVMIFFLLPVKVKFLAILYAALMLWDFITGSWQGRIALLISLLNIALFFGGDFIHLMKRLLRKFKWKKDTGGFKRAGRKRVKDAKGLKRIK